MSTYTPAQVVAETGFTLDTLRYYERIGLLDGVDRNAAGQRRFTDGHLDWLSLIRCLRERGMPIADIARYAQLVRAGDDTVPERIRLLQAHDRRIREQIAAGPARRIRRSTARRAG
jgi:DNA-binding transcriptional MerR regulator